MKIIRTNRFANVSHVKRCFTVLAGMLVLAGILQTAAGAQSSDAPRDRLPGASSPAETESATMPSTTAAAARLIDQVLLRMAGGQPYDAKVRQRVWAAGREVVGVGTYVQAGGGTSAYSLQMTMHDGNGKHTMQQVSDGRLAYTRTEVADRVSLTRVDVGWLDEGLRAMRREFAVPPSIKVGGLGEMLDSIRRDYELKLGVSQTQGRPLHVIIGRLKPSRRDALLTDSVARPLASLLPTRVNVFIAATDDPQTGFGKGLPVRIEHRGDRVTPPETTPAAPGGETRPRRSAANQGQLISLIEFYSVRPISPPPIQRFRFENQDASVTFVNETSRYERRFDIRVTAKQRAKYR